MAAVVVLLYKSTALVGTTSFFEHFALRRLHSGDRLKIPMGKTKLCFTLVQKIEIFPKIPFLKIPFLTKFTISNSHFLQNSNFETSFSQNSQSQILIFYKILNFEASFFGKIHNF